MKNSFYHNVNFTGKDVLIVVPHMDDEINVAGGMLYNLAEMRCNISVIYVTNCDGFGEGKVREEEAKRALQILTGRKIKIYILDYRDQARTGAFHYLFSKKEEVVGELAEILVESRPEIIFSCDMDKHPDHLCTSLFFEEALGRVLRKTEDYSPLVYKGFAYETAYFATDDLFAANGFSVLHTKKNLFKGCSNPVYLWHDRVRFPLKEACLLSGKQIKENVVYRALAMHRTQNAISHAGRIINSDQVFWERRTDSFSYRSEIFVTSGEKRYLNDFMRVNVKDVLQRKLRYQSYLWIPERGDKQKMIHMEFAAPIICNKIVFYQNIRKSQRVKMVQICFDNGCTINWNMTGDSAIRMEKCFPDVCIKWLEFRVLESSGRYAGISELEVYHDEEKKSLFALDYIKIMHKGNFVYDLDYCKRPEYEIYGYCVHSGSRRLSGGEITEYIRKNDRGQEILKVELKGNSGIYDEVTLHKVSVCRIYWESFFYKICLGISAGRNIRDWWLLNTKKFRMLYRILKNSKGNAKMFFWKKR